MSVGSFADGAITLKNPRISDEDAARQERTARVLLERLASQPGVILADEVGMGKTFVALAVAVSTILAHPDAGPVVVMVPSTLKNKWPRDWDVFKQLCLKTAEARAIRACSALSGVEFLRLLDDSPERRKHLIFMPHGALGLALRDHWIRLALIQRAFKGRSSLREQRDKFPEWAGKILREESRYESRVPGILGKLLERPSSDWLRTLHRAHEKFRDYLDDDPVPEAVQQVLDDMDSTDLESLVEALRRLPLRRSEHIDERLIDVRRELAKEMRELWDKVLRTAQFTSPLLILDEAHHLKNPQTRFASLFIDEEATADSETVSNGPLAGKFDRMLFLTATPFQLGHSELIRVLERFQGIRWTSKHPPTLTRERFLATLNELGAVLDKAQASALRLERAWGRLDARHLKGPDGTQRTSDAWWSDLCSADQQDPALTDVLRHVAVTTEAMRAAEAALSPWVIRNVKPRHLAGHPDIPRRAEKVGAAILENGPSSGGLDLGGEALLPFLLAGRAQILLALSEKGRAFFADGLASSFEAYKETRKALPGVDEEDASISTATVSPPIAWYLDQLDRALPPDSSEAYLTHPKIAATVDRVVRLWLAGEKVLVFCHYRATGRALRRHISQRLQDEIVRLGAEAMPDVEPAAVMARLAEIGEQFFREESPLRQQVDQLLSTLVSSSLLPTTGHDQSPAITQDELDKVVEVIRRFLRTPSFLVRYFPITSPDEPDVFAHALEKADQSGVPLRTKLESFCRFLASRVPEERREYLEALDSIQTGSYATENLEELFDGAEHDDGRKPIRLPNVRLVNGESRNETRRRLLLGFNTPLFPEILVASSVLAEGVDLHLNCRYIIHHDLCWNPSTLEQRSGRVDRIGSKAEQVKASIHLFLPFVAATRDEKMFRVVKDRERWFQIVLGEKYQTDELSLDKVAERVELPEALREKLSLKLH